MWSGAFEAHLAKQEERRPRAALQCEAGVDEIRGRRYNVLHIAALCGAVSWLPSSVSQ